MSDPVEVVTEVEVVEPVVEDSNAEPAEPKADDPKAEDTKTEEPKKNHDSRRWERLMRERAEFKAKADYLEQQVQAKKAETAVTGRPARDQFGSDEDYVDALTTWKVDQKLSGVKEQLSQHQMQSQAQASWVSKINQARAEYSDYDRIMEDAQDIPIEPAVAEAIQSSEIGGDVAYYLAKHPEEAIRINSLSPMSAAREIGRIESYVEYEKGQKAKKPPVSKAPAPIQPVKASSAPGTKSLEDMTPAEYMAFRNKQEAASKRRR